MSGSLVEQLQLAACDNATSVADLLRKALLVASKLEVPAVPEWIRKELSGYGDGGDVPPYRRVHGVVRAFNPTFRTVVAHDFVRGGGLGGLLAWTVDGGRY